MEQKKITGRKRQISVDTHGNLIKARVQAANIQDYAARDDVVAETLAICPTIVLFWVDGGYRHSADEIQSVYEITINVVKKDSAQRTFVVLPRRWVVERTLAWLNRYRILSKEYTHRPEYTESWMYLASIHRIVNRIAPSIYRKQAYHSKSRNDAINCSL